MQPLPSANAGAAPDRGWAKVFAGSLARAILPVGGLLSMGGGWMAVLTGSPRLFLAGIFLLCAAVQLSRGKRSGAWLIVLFYVLFSVWTEPEVARCKPLQLASLWAASILAATATFLMPWLGSSITSRWAGMATSALIIAGVTALTIGA